jgi:hypothetical protein
MLLGVVERDTDWNRLSAADLTQSYSAPNI